MIDHYFSPRYWGILVASILLSLGAVHALESKFPANESTRFCVGVVIGSVAVNGAAWVWMFTEYLKDRDR